MTFYEAAVEVLRVAGRPLHYKKITEIAIKRGLLSHIGKAPELTMGNRLNQEVRKDDGTNVVVRTRPGVFALRAWMDKGGLVPARVAETTGMARAILEGIEPEVGDIEELLRGDDPENPREPSARVAAVVVVPPVVASVLPSLVSDDAEEGEPEGEVEGEPEEERAERRRPWRCRLSCGRPRRRTSLCVARARGRRWAAARSLGGRSAASLWGWAGSRWRRGRSCARSQGVCWARPSLGRGCLGSAWCASTRSIGRRR
jgi:hypothetical protein